MDKDARTVMMCPHCKTNNELPSYLAPPIFCCYCGKKLSGLPKEKPPLLSDEEIWKIYEDGMKRMMEGEDLGEGNVPNGRRIAQTQLNICIKHYEE